MYARMKNTISYGLLSAVLACLLCTASATYYPIDNINGRHYVGNYSANQ